MIINVEIAKISDIPELVRMLKQLYIELGEEIESVDYVNESLLKKMLSNDKTTMLKAVFENSEILGILSLTESQAIYAGGFYGVIDEMYVQPTISTVRRISTCSGPTSRGAGSSATATNSTA